MTDNYDDDDFDLDEEIVSDGDDKIPTPRAKKEPQSKKEEVESEIITKE